MIVALAGGVGGAKMAQGLALALDPDELTVIVNTADDFELYGLRISPDIDTVLYTLSGLVNPATGWGIAGDSRSTLDAIARLGRDPWFFLGDQDFATHILRTERLRIGESLTTVTADLTEQLGVSTRVLPMSDDRVATLVETPDGILDFQEYFVRRRQQDEVLGVVFQGIDLALPGADVLEAIQRADLVVICPSNPIVSIGPILAVAGIREALATTRAARVAISPIIGGRALKGPADKMLETLGHEVSAVGVSKIYDGLIDGFVIDNQDETLRVQIEETGIRVLVTQSIMGDADDRKRFAGEVLTFGYSVARQEAGVS